MFQAFLSTTDYITVVRCVCVPLQYTHASFLIGLPRSNLVWLPPLAPAYRENVVILGEELSVGKWVLCVNNPCSRIHISLNRASLRFSTVHSDLFCSLAKLRHTSAGNFPSITGINIAPYDSGVVPRESRLLSMES